MSQNLRPFLIIDKAAEEDFRTHLNVTSDHNAVVVGLAPDQFHYENLNKAFRYTFPPSSRCKQFWRKKNCLLIFLLTELSFWVNWCEEWMDLSHMERIFELGTAYQTCASKMILKSKSASKWHKRLIKLSFFMEVIDLLDSPPPFNWALLSNKGWMHNCRVKITILKPWSHPTASVKFVCSMPKKKSKTQAVHCNTDVFFFIITLHLPLLCWTEYNFSHEDRLKCFGLSQQSHVFLGNFQT